MISFKTIVPRFLAVVCAVATMAGCAGGGATTGAHDSPLGRQMQALKTKALQTFMPAGQIPASAATKQQLGITAWEIVPWTDYHTISIVGIAADAKVIWDVDVMANPSTNVTQVTTSTGQNVYRNANGNATVYGTGNYAYDDTVEVALRSDIEAAQGYGGGGGVSKGPQPASVTRRTSAATVGSGMLAGALIVVGGMIAITVALAIAVPAGVVLGAVCLGAVAAGLVTVFGGEIKMYEALPASAQQDLWNGNYGTVLTGVFTGDWGSYETFDCLDTTMTGGVAMQVCTVHIHYY